MKARNAVNQKASSKSGGLLPQVTKRGDCKTNCRKVKKAQLVFEFIVAVLIFFGIVFYAINYLSWTVAGYSSDFSVENMESEASQIGELLVLNKGNWSGGTPITVGLAQEWPVLNSTKITWLNSSCNNNYDGFVKKLDVQPRYRMKITVRNETSFLADCRWGQPISGNVTRADVRRYALSESGNVLTVYVVIWTTGK
ncbi:MAG: hypothetical protein NTY20_00525 [Candidatus Aenigmarchaeota archaeon]|nr:hypothetical protein [Candidatus Aenigmarchaeota archaeon]